MFPSDCAPSRRTFLFAGVAFTATVSTLALPVSYGAADDSGSHRRSKQGYSPQIGTLVRKWRFMRDQVLHSVKGMSQADLDFLLDNKPTPSVLCFCIWRRGKVLFSSTLFKAFQRVRFRNRSRKSGACPWS